MDEWNGMDGWMESYRAFLASSTIKAELFAIRITPSYKCSISQLIVFHHN